MNKFVVIDGHAILHRAFHALPPLTNSKGQMLNAAYGFLSMFLKILEDVHPQYIVVCFDRPKPTFRKTLYVGYQAHRPQMSEELGPQIPIVHKILEEMGVTIFEMDGYEADDLIGTLSVQALGANQESGIRNQGEKNQKSKIKIHNSDLEVIIVSGDRDMLQLVNSHVKVLAPITGITNMILFNEQNVEKKFRVKSSQIADYKALVGDASDNYPGVAGIGPKTASFLLKEFNTLENIYNNLETVKQKNPNLALKLAEGAEAAGLAKKLSEIVKDVPITLDIEKCNIKNLNWRKAEDAFRELEFKSLVRRLEERNLSIKRQEEEEKQEKNKQLSLL